MKGAPRRLQGCREQHPALVKADEEALLDQGRLAPKRLGAAGLREAAGGEITAARWQRADIH